MFAFRSERGSGSHGSASVDAWQKTRAPFWPDDFDYRHFQAAPPDQQIPYLQGGKEVIMINLSPQGRVQFYLPTIPMPVIFIPYQGGSGCAGHAG